MKLFLNRARSTRPTVFSNDSSVSPQKPTMKSLETGHAGDRLADPGQHLVVEADRVHPLHPLEDLVAAALGGDVEVSRDPGQVADGLEQVVGHVVGEVGDELDPLDAGQMSWSRSSRSESRVIAAVGLAELVAVDGLAEQGDLLDPLVGELPRLVDDRAGGPALLGAADRGDDAVGAELVAAHHDPDERLERAGPHRGLAVGVVLLEARRDRLARARRSGPG